MPEQTSKRSMVEKALRVIQRDLDATLTGYTLQIIESRGDGDVSTVWFIGIQGRGHEAGAVPIELDSCRPVDVLIEVAAVASQALIELEQVVWPACPIHDGYQLDLEDRRGKAWWVCVRGSHELGQAGSL